MLHSRFKQVKVPKSFSFDSSSVGTSVSTDAVIMVCESNDGGSVLDPNNAPASNDLPVGEESDTVGEMSETQDPGRLSRNLPKSPLLRRPSLALVLNVGDTGEVATKPQLRDKKSVWWDNKGLDSKKEGRQKGASSWLQIHTKSWH